MHQFRCCYKERSEPKIVYNCGHNSHLTCLNCAEDIGHIMGAYALLTASIFIETVSKQKKISFSFLLNSQILSVPPPFLFFFHSILLFLISRLQKLLKTVRQRFFETQMLSEFLVLRKSLVYIHVFLLFTSYAHKKKILFQSFLMYFFVFTFSGQFVSSGDTQSINSIYDNSPEIAEDLESTIEYDYGKDDTSIDLYLDSSEENIDNSDAIVIDSDSDCSSPVRYAPLSSPYYYPAPQPPQTPQSIRPDFLNDCEEISSNDSYEYGFN